MSSRRTLAVTFSSALLGAFGTVALAAGCSENTKAAAANDASSDATPDVATSKPLESDAPVKSCRETCEETHGAALPKDEAINSCWETHCGGPCIEQVPDDGGALDGGTCSTPVVTVSESCDRCSSTFCCAEWDACFQDPACTALNACYQTCAE
ncbi:MAG TPA: hypothetical protein VM925_04235 [Labilithrix sp.]|jgi:hypothetical protein|nr:hypothetical protein [Labilithrix sp.]